MIDVVASLASFAIARCGAVQVDVHRTGVAPLALRGAVGASWEGDPCGPRPRLRLRLRDARGQATSMLVQPEVTVWVNGLQAARPAASGQPVVTRTARIALDPRHGLPVADGPWVARVPLSAGEALTDLVVAPPLAARRGDAVDVVVRRGPVVLSVPGELLTDGHAGHLVRVRHDASDRVLQGTLVTPTTVEIR